MLEVISVLDSDRHNIVQFLERFVHDGLTCLAFESLDQSLFDAIQEQNGYPLHLQWIRPIAKQVCIIIIMNQFRYLLFCGSTINQGLNPTP